MSNFNFCPECGTKVDPSWRACPNCGYFLSETLPSQESMENIPEQPIQPTVTAPSSYSYPSKTYYTSQGGNIFGIIAIIFGILGLCCFGVICGIIALILGIIGQTRDESKGLATAGVVLGILDLCCSLMLLFLPISFFFQM
jgi:hypothetical protein